MSNTFTINSQCYFNSNKLRKSSNRNKSRSFGCYCNINSDNSITLSNTTGNDIVVGGNAPTDAGFTAGTYLGYIKLENVDGTFV